MNTQNASNELRTLEAAEVDSVSGAAREVIDMGLFGKLSLSNKGGAAEWWTTEDNDGGTLTTTITQWPK